jgi:signal peptidase I
MAEPARKKRKITGFGLALLPVLALCVLLYFNVRTVVVSGNSMMPTFEPGRRLLVSDAYWLIGPVRKNDIVVLSEFGGRKGFWIKRVYRTAGEPVERVNFPRQVSMREPEYRVPEGQVYLMGDNRSFSEDSRSFGPVPVSLIIGKVLIWR